MYLNTKKKDVISGSTYIDLATLKWRTNKIKQKRWKYPK